MPSSGGPCRAGRRSHAARARREPERAGGGLGIGEARRARAMPDPALMTTGEDRLLGARRRTRDRCRDVVGRRDDRRHEERDHRVDAGVREHDRKHGLVRRRGGRAEHVHRVRDARLARAATRRSAARVSSASVGQLEPGGFARVGAEDAEPAGVRERRRRGAPAGAAASRGTRRVERALPACARESRRPARTARRRRRRSPRARRCASSPRALPRGSSRSPSRGSASLRATRLAMRANLRGLPNDSR